MIGQIAQKSIKEMVRNNDVHIESYIRSMVNCWKMDGFKSEFDAKMAYQAFIIASRIRHYCRAKGITTRKGSYFSTNKNYDPGLWDIVTKFDTDVMADGITWQWRRVDQLRNIKVWF